MNEVKWRIITGSLLAIYYLLIITVSYQAYLFMFLTILVVSFLAMKEYFKMLLPGNPGLLNISAIFGFIINIWIYLYSFKSPANLQFSEHSDILNNLAHSQFTDFSTFLMIIFVFSCLLISTLIVSDKMVKAFNNIAISLYSIVYISLPLSLLYLLRADINGLFLILFLSWGTIQTDIMSYISGKLLGKHKISLQVSPNKTVEGYIGGFILQVLLSIGFYLVYIQFDTSIHYSLISIIFAAIFIFIISVIGDLGESLLKRSVGKKDSGNIFPGHGGVLDRIDSLLFSIPGFYFFHQVFLQ